MPYGYDDDQPYTSPDQRAMQRKIAEFLAERSNYVPNAEMAKLPGTWMYGVPNVLDALSGRLYQKQALEGELAGQARGAAKAIEAHKGFYPNSYQGPSAPYGSNGASGRGPTIPDASGVPGTTLSNLPDQKMETGSLPDTNTASGRGSVVSQPLSEDFFNKVKDLESGHNYNLINKYGYKGAYQFSNEELRKYGITGNDWRNPEIMEPVARRHFAALNDEVTQKLGRPPNAGELYLSHQRGVDGFLKGAQNPDKPEWVNMLNTGEGRQRYAKDPQAAIDWAQRTVRDNVPKTDPVKRQLEQQYGSKWYLNMTSGQFQPIWTKRFDNNRFSGRSNLGAGDIAAAQGEGSPAGSPPGSQQSPGLPPQAGGAQVAQGYGQPGSPASGMPAIWGATNMPRDVGEPVARALQSPFNRATSQDAQRYLADPNVSDEAKKTYLENIVKAGTPQSMDVQGGKAIFNAQTGQQGFVGQPIKGKLDLGNGVTIDAIHSFDPNTQQWITKPLIPGAQNQSSGAAPNGTGGNSGLDALNPLTQWSRDQKAQTGISDTLAQAKALPVAEAIKAGIAAPAAIKTLNTVLASSRAGGKDLTRGFPAELALEVEKVLGWNPAGRPYGEVIEKLNRQLSSQSVQAFTSRGTNFDIQTFMGANPSLQNSEAGLELLVDVLNQEHQSQIALGRLANRVKPDNAGDWQETVDAYHRKNPIILHVPQQTDRQGRVIIQKYSLNTTPVNSIDEARQLVKEGILKPGQKFVTPQNKIMSVPE